MTTKTPEHDLPDVKEVEAISGLQSNPLHELQIAIATLPAVDAAKVAQVIEKMRQGKIAINPESIAQKIMDESSGI